MNTMRDVLDKDRRLAILRFLSEADGYCLNESVILSALKRIAHQAWRDGVQADLVLLDQHGLVTLEEIGLPGKTLKVATLTSLGHEVVQGRAHPVVARPSPGA